MLELHERGAVTFDYGNNMRARAFEAGLKNAFDFPGFVPAYIRPLFCEGKGPFRWAALSGDPQDIRVTDTVMMELFPKNEAMIRWIKTGQRKNCFPGTCPRGSAGWGRVKEKKQALLLTNWLKPEK